MKIIPVIDLFNGVVVHAKNGERKKYLPIASPLTPSTNAVDIVNAFLNIYPFDTLYIADLNAIQQTNIPRNNLTEIQKIQQNFPDLTIWLDAGISQLSDTEIWQDIRCKLVVGTENIQSIAQYLAIQDYLKNPILSLDFLPQGYQGPDTLLSAEYWPENIIVMTLNKVGSGTGFDQEILFSLLQHATSTHQIYAAGGVRNIADLLQLKASNVRGALVASALHNRQLNTADIAMLYNESTV